MKKKLKIIFILMNLIIGSGLLFAVENAPLKKTSQDSSKNIPEPLLRIISIDLENIPLEKALSIITGKGKLKLNYNRRDIWVSKKVSVKMDHVPIIKVLNNVLIDTDSKLVVTKGGLFAIIPKEKKRSRKGTISGKVSETYNNREIAGANVQVMNTTFSTITNENGEFIIPNVPVGSYNVKFSSNGFKTVVTADVIIRPKRITYVNANLEYQLLEINESVDVSGNYFPVDEKNPVSVVTISSEEVRRAPGTGGGITRMLKVLPGITTADDENTDLIVRGGSSYENGYIIDNIEIPSISHLPRLASGGSFSALQADLIQNVNIHTGGFSSNYGDFLSSITDITLREGNRDEFDGQLDFHMAGAGFIFEGPISKDRGSWLVSLRRFDMKIIKNFISIGGSPAATDAQFKMSCEISPTQKINLLYFHLSGHLYEGGSWIQSKLKCSLHTVGINWMAIWNPNFFSNTSLALTSFRKLNGERYFYIYPDTFPLVEKTWDIWEVDDLSGTLSLRNSNYLVLNNRNKLEFGLQVKHESDRLEEVFYPLTDSPYPLPDSNRDWTKQQQINYRYNTTKLGLFFSYIGTFYRRLTTTIGLRGDYSSAHDIFHLSPRFSLRYKINPRLSLNGGAGLFYQTLPTAFLAFIPTAVNLKDMKAVHYTLGMEWLPGHGTRLTLEGYIKEYDNLPISPDNPRWLAMDYAAALSRDNIYSPVGYRAPGTLDDRGSGYSRGIELLIQKKLTNKFYGFISASYFRCKYKDLLGETHNRVYDNRCIINLSGGYKPNRNWEFSTRWTIVGGGPYTPIDVEVSRQSSWWVLDDSRFLRSRYPTYNSLNLRVDKRFYFSGSNLTLFLDLWNALNHKNGHFYWWEAGSNQIKTAYQIEFMPIFGVEYEF
jgi:hypothetical protein